MGRTVDRRQRWTCPPSRPGTPSRKAGKSCRSACSTWFAGTRGIALTQTIEVLARDTGFKVIELGADRCRRGSSTPQLIQIGLTPRVQSGTPPHARVHALSVDVGTAVASLAGVFALLAVAAFFASAGGIQRPADAEAVVEHGRLNRVWDRPANVARLERRTTPDFGGEKETRRPPVRRPPVHLDSAFVKSIERTTTELVAQLRHATIRGLSASDITWLSEVLQRSDLVKFARQSMPHDAHQRAVADALHWVEHTQPILDPDDPRSEPNTPNADV